MSAPARDVQIEVLLTRLQHELERRGGEPVRQRRRLIMRGIRIACWALEGRVPVEEVEQELRMELFGPPVGLPGTTMGIQLPQGEV